MRFGSRLASDQRGVSAMEYALIVAMIALGIVGSLDRMGSSSAKGFNEVAEAFPGDGGGGNGGGNGGNGGGNGNGKGKGKGKGK